MLPAELEEQFTDFYQAAYADGEVDGKTKVLIGMAVAMTVGCYP
jgi:alkylhydroperoxidase/carboxymuconolactone decarboxylase family protein YurZ